MAGWFCPADGIRLGRELAVGLPRLLAAHQGQHQGFDATLGVAVGTALLGLSVFNIGVPSSSAIHALTAGAIAVMILAVMPRVTLGHTGRDLVANRATILAFALINAAAIARVCASWHTALMATLLLIAGALWIAAFVLFELV